jgi:adenine-specific DNA-methyltransferase
MIDTPDALGLDFDLRDSTNASGHQHNQLVIQDRFITTNQATLHHGDCLEILAQIPTGCTQLVMTSPPYNIGKVYEKRITLEMYLQQQTQVISECARILAPGASLCWQVGNYIEEGEVYPLDILFYPIIKAQGLNLRNRIVWRIEHGLHAKNRFSGRHETVLWFTKGDYIFNVDPVRIPQKYPGKRHYKGPKAGEYSGNPLGKNPGDVWDIPNVKNNHVEKTIHPAAYPIELVERFILSLTQPGDLVFDPYMGSGSSGCAALLHGRRTAGAETMSEYIEIIIKRWQQAHNGDLPKRAMGQAIYEPVPGTALTTRNDLPAMAQAAMAQAAMAVDTFTPNTPKTRGRPRKSPAPTEDYPLIQLLDAVDHKT